MQINAINSINFEGKRAQKAAKQEKISHDYPQSKGFMSGLRGPVAAAMFLVPVIMMPSCDKIDVRANAEVTVPINPNPKPEIKFPYEIEDSLNHYRDYIKIPAKGDDGVLTNKALMYIKGRRNWDFNKLDSIGLNLKKSSDVEAVYDHKVGDYKSDLRVTVVKPGTDLIIVRKDGKEIMGAGGMLFNDDGVKIFVQSNGKNKLTLYPKSTSGENKGKYVELGTFEPGYLGKEKYGDNFLLYNILSPGTEDHMINMESQVRKAEDVIKEYEEAEIVE